MEGLQTKRVVSLMRAVMSPYLKLRKIFSKQIKQSKRQKTLPPWIRSGEQEAVDSDTITQRDKEILESQYENIGKLQKQASDLAVQQSVQQTQACFLI